MKSRKKRFAQFLKKGMEKSLEEISKVILSGYPGVSFAGIREEITEVYVKKFLEECLNENLTELSE